MSRAALAVRQREVLDDLLAGRVPEGFAPVGARMTTRVLHAKRADAALAAAPELAWVPRWRPRFHAWAAAHPVQGCAHDDVRAFLASLDGAWLRLHEVYDGRRRVTIAGGVTYIGIGSLVLRLGRRRKD